MKRFFVLFLITALLLPLPIISTYAQGTKKGDVAPRTSAPSKKATVAPIDKEEEEESADIPPFARGKISPEEYFERRDGYIRQRTGADAPRAALRRLEAIRQMEQQERAVREQQSLGAQPGGLDASIRNSTSWTSIGPAPLPNGQTETATTPVSGRTTAVAIHPTNPNIVYVGTAQGGVYRSTDGGVTWLAIFDKAQSLAIGSLALAPSNPSILYVGTGEPNGSCDSYYGVGFYRVENADTLPKLFGPFNSDGTNDVMTGRASGASIAVHPTDPNIIFVTTTSAAVGKNCESPFGGTLPPLPARGIFRSTNALGAMTFTKMSTITATNVVVGNFPHVDVVMDPSNPNRVLTTVNAASGAGNAGGGVFLSTNALAATPTFTNTLSLNAVRAELALKSNGASDPTVYVASGESNGRLRRSTNGGATWSAVLTAANGFCGGQCFYDIALAVNPNNDQEVQLGGNVTGAATKLIAKSTTGGTAFTNNASGVHADNHVVRYAPSDPSILYMGTDGGVYKSTNGGTSWSSVSTMGFNATQFQSIAVHPTNQYFTLGGTQDNGTELLQADNTWRRADFGDGGYALIDQNAIDTTTVTMYHTYFNQINAMGYARVTTTAAAQDDGWTFFGCGFSGSVPNGMTCAATAIQFYAPMALGPGSPFNTLYFGSDVLYRSINSGVTVTKVSQEPIVSGQPITDMGIAPTNDNVRLVGLLNGTVWGTNSGATTLTNFTTAGMPARGIGDIQIDPTNPAVAYVAYTGFTTGVAHIWKTTNLTGATPTFTASGTGIPDISVNAIAIDPMNASNVYAGTDIGVYRSTDGGASWTPYNDGLPRIAVFDMVIQNANRLLRIATHGRGMWQVALAPAQRMRGDFDQDGQTEIAIWRGSTGDWVLRNSTSGYLRTHPDWGRAALGDKIVPGDYDNDNKVDFAVWREPSGTWFIANSADLSTTIKQWGQPSDIPVPGDYDGDGKTDLAVFRPSDGNWYIINSSNNTVTQRNWGLSTDRPVPADYDGDAKTDIAIFRPSEGKWYIINSGNNTVTQQAWGESTDKVVPGDYDGDDKADLAVFRSGQWLIRKSTGGSTVQNWGDPTDILVPGDYDKDGKVDLAVWRPSDSNWYILLSSGGSRTENLGFATAPTDVPVPSGYIPAP